MFYYVARATGASPRSLAKDSGRRSIPRSLATDVAWPRRSVAKDLGEFYGDLAREVIGQGPPESLAKGGDVLRSLPRTLAPEVLGQGGVCCFIIWPRPSGNPPGPWPRTPAGGSSRGPRPRTVLGPRRSLAKDLVESYGDIVQEVFGYGPLEVLGQGPLEVLGQDGGDKLKSYFIVDYVARARAIARISMRGITCE